MFGQRLPFVPEKEQAKYRALRERAAAGEIHSGVELPWQRKDGTAIDVSLWAAPIRDSAGQIIDILVLIIEDITERKRAEETLVQRTRQFEAVRSISAEIARELDLGVLLGLIHRRAMELVGAEGGSLFLWDEATQRLMPQVWHGIPDSVGVLALGLGEGLCGIVAERREGLMVNDYRAFRNAHPRILADTTVNAVLAEPLRFHDTLVGVIAVNHQAGGRSFSSEDQQILGVFATQAAIAIENARLYQDAGRQRREIEVVADLSQRLNASLDLDTVLQRVADGARELTGSDLAQIALRDGESPTLSFRYRAGSHVARLDTHRIELGKGVGGRVMATGRPFRTDNYPEDPRITKDYLATTLAESIVAELAVPIQTEGQLQGILFVDNRSPRPFTQQDERTLQRLADHAAIAIRNARLHAVAVRHAQQLSTLNSVTRTLTTELDPQDVTRGILEAVQILIPGATCRLLEQVEGLEVFHAVASIGLHEPKIAEWSPPRLGVGFAGIAAATREPVISEDVTTDPRFLNRAWAASEGLVSGVILPLMCRDRVIGILSVFLRRRHIFTDEEVNLLRALAAEGAIALENARLFEQVRAGREQLLDLTQRLVSAQEEERHRLSRELHDEAGQALTVLRISLGLIREELPQEADMLRQRLSETLALTESVFDQVRRLVQVLRPPALDALGVNAALEGFCRDFSRRTRLSIKYAGTELARLPESVGIHLYRVLQEGLTNVTKHAQAHQIRVTLTRDGDTITLSVEDDGVGFDASTQQAALSPKGIGLIGMRERLDLLKGRLDIWSQPGHGTRLVAQVPLRGAS